MCRESPALPNVNGSSGGEVSVGSFAFKPIDFAIAPSCFGRFKNEAQGHDNQREMAPALLSATRFFILSGIKIVLLYLPPPPHPTLFTSSGLPVANQDKILDMFLEGIASDMIIDWQRP